MVDMEGGSRDQQSTSLAFIQNTLRNMLLYRHLVQCFLVMDRPLSVDY